MTDGGFLRGCLDRLGVGERLPGCHGVKKDIQMIVTIRSLSIGKIL